MNNAKKKPVLLTLDFQKSPRRETIKMIFYKILCSLIRTYKLTSSSNIGGNI